MNKHNHIDTFYIGCEDNGERATFENRVLRIHWKFNMAHRRIIGALSPHFFMAQVIAEENITNEPYKLAIYHEVGAFDRKVKEENQYTKKENFYFFIKNMHPPKNGMIISFYEVETMNRYIPPYEDFRHTWPLKKEWHWIGDGDYITLQNMEKRTEDRIKNVFTSHSNYSIMKDVDNISIYPIKRLDYTMPEEEIFTLLKHAKFHLSYPGATYYDIHLIGCPTIGLYMKKEFEDVTYKDETGQIISVTVPLNMGERINNFCVTSGYLGYDFEKERACIRHQTLLRHVTNEELECYLKGYADYK